VVDRVDPRGGDQRNMEEMDDFVQRPALIGLPGATQCASETGRGLGCTRHIAITMPKPPRDDSDVVAFDLHRRAACLLTPLEPNSFSITATILHNRASIVV
jgi:hypothetical protein